MPSFNNSFSLDDVCYLLSTHSIKDELGQAIISEKPYMVFCSRLSITRAEFNAAGQLGYKPEIMLVVDSQSYNKELFLEYNKTKYKIYKSFMRLDDFTELYCEVKAGD